MTTHPRISRLATLPTLFLLLLSAGQACAQGSGGGTPPSTVAPPALATGAAPADPQIESFKAMLAGSWQAAGKEPTTGEDAEFWMHIAPVAIEGIDNALYVEQCRGDDPTTPYRQAVFQAYRNKGKLRLRTLEFRVSSPEAGGPWAQSWLVPDLFPAVSMDDLIATLDLEFVTSAAGFDGKTPYPYPSAMGGAVEMTSEMKVSKDKLVTTDKGFGPDGKVAWSTSGGSVSPESLTWVRADAGFKVQRDEDGLVILTLVESPDGGVAADGDTMFLDYALFLADGTMIDSSSKSGRLLPMSVPQTPGRGMIPGFFRGVVDAPEGTVRRLIIPSALGYGEAGRQSIPGNSTLYFRAEVNTVQKPVPPPEAAQPAPEGGEGGEKPADGGGH